MAAISLAFLFAAPVCAGPAMAQSDPQQQDRALLELRLVDLENQLRRLTGQYEETLHRLRQLEQRLAHMEGDAGFRAGGGSASGAGQRPLTGATPPGQGQGQDQGVGEGPGILNAPPGTGAGGDILPAPGVTMSSVPESPLPEGAKPLYDHALAVLQRGDYLAAQTALEAFLKKYSNDGLAPNAHYWLGETHYVRNEYAPAAKSFLAGYEKFPASDKAPDMLLKLGISLNALGAKDEACAAFSDLAQQHGSAPSNITERGKAEAKRIGCP